MCMAQLQTHCAIGEELKIEARSQYGKYNLHIRDRSL